MIIRTIRKKLKRKQNRKKTDCVNFLRDCYLCIIQMITLFYYYIYSIYIIL